jgi:hypothetical protein
LRRGTATVNEQSEEGAAWSWWIFQGIIHSPRG